MEPNRVLLAKLAQATTEAEANSYTRPVKLPKPVKIKPPKAPRLKRPKVPKPPKPPKVPKPPKFKLPKASKEQPPKPRPIKKVRRQRRAVPRPQPEASPTFTITDLPDGIVAVEHHTQQSGKSASLVFDATDLQFYLQRVWQITGDGLLVSGYARDQIRLHRLIVGATPGERVVFRNGNTFDFRRENLLMGGICRNYFGLTAHGVYPFYVKRGAERVLWGVRTVVVQPGNGTARERRIYRHFSFEKYGEQEAHRRAYILRIKGLHACG